MAWGLLKRRVSDMLLTKKDNASLSTMSVADDVSFSI